MGLTKKKFMKYEELLKGSDERVAILGGFLDVQIDSKTICTVSIPIPNLLTIRYRDSVSEWSEKFVDLENNSYLAMVWSGIDGVNWDIRVELDKSNSNKHIILERIKIEIHYTEEA